MTRQTNLLAIFTIFVRSNTIDLLSENVCHRVAKKRDKKPNKQYSSSNFILMGWGNVVAVQFRTLLCGNVCVWWQVGPTFLTQTFKMVSCMRIFRAILLRIQHHGILISWIILVSLIFWSSYSQYMTDPRYFYLREIIGHGLLISRAMASVINVSSFLVIIPMSRTFTTYIRVFASKVSVKYVRHCIDASRTFHVICAFTILTAGCFHSIAHVINAFNFSSHYNLMYKDINVANFKGEDPLNSVVGTVPGITGVFMIVILITLASTAVQCVRSINYELFWFSHHLFLLFFLLLLLHPTSGLLKEQINIVEHPPGCIINTSENNTSDERRLLICDEDPIFVSQISVTWKWIAAGLTVYTIDMGVRILRRRNHAQLEGFQVHKCDVMHLRLLKADFEAKPGQYLYLQFPKISILEWHPFSISRCPSTNDPSFTIHLRTNGDWSGTVKKHLMNEASEKLVPTNVRDTRYNCLSTPLNERFLIDGPYSSCFEDILKYSVSICIAGGIGFTPFASILNFLRIDFKNLSKIKRIHLFWICREVEIFTCFSKLLADVFKIVWDAKHPDKFEFCLYLTKEQPWRFIEDVLQDSFPLLRPRILFGRPEWNILFEHWADLYEKTDVGLFCCGPESLNCEVQKLSQKWNCQGCRYSYHQEVFS